jgi:hypothetical protein
MFSSMKDVEAYLGGDKLECLICGRVFAGLQQHVNRAHDMSAREYKLRFGLPLSRPLWGSETRSALVEAGKAWHERRSAESLESLRVAQRAANTRNYNSNLIPAVAAARRGGSAAKRVAGAANYRALLAGQLTRVTCPTCGASFDYSIAVARRLHFRIYCEPCRQAAVLASRKKFNAGAEGAAARKKHKAKYRAKISSSERPLT